MLFSFLCVLGCTRKFVYLAFVCYVSASSSVFEKADFQIKYGGLGREVDILELGRHVSDNRFD